MSFRDCIDNALKEGSITPDQADDLRRRYGDAEDELALDYGPEAGNEAARRVMDDVRFETLEARRRKLLQAQKGRELVALANGFTGYNGSRNPGHFMSLLISDENGKAGTSTVEGRYKAIKGRAHARITDAIFAFERDALGSTRNKSLLRDVVRARFGEEAPDNAKVLAAAIEEAFEFLRLRFNAAGGHIGKLENWGLPQSHDAVAIARGGKQSWIDFVRPRLDRSKMLARGGDRELSDGEIEILLGDVYETLATNGANKISLDGHARGRSKATTRADHRILHFASADDWMAYQDAYGQGDAFAAIVGHIDEMARDVGAMEILGPNPMAGLRLLERNATTWAGLEDARKPGQSLTFRDRVAGDVNLAMNTYAHFSGSSDVPVVGHVARVFRSIRNLLTASQLGSAVFAALPSDQAMRALARSYSGLQPMKDLGEVFKLMKPGSETEKKALVNAALIADGATQQAAAMARYTHELDATGMTARIADTVLRASGLSPWTQAMRWSFGMEVMGNLGIRAGRTVGELLSGDEPDQAFARMLERHGLLGSWEDIRRAPLYQPEEGAAFLRPEDVLQVDGLTPSRADYLANRLLEMIHAETDFAVPSGNSKTRALIVRESRPGTPLGEVIRSTAMYKSFAVHISYLIGSRTMEQAALGGARAAAGYLGTMTLAMGLSGAISLQLKDIAKGRDPRPMASPEFWGAAMLQGGGLGIFGDFVFSDRNRFGGGLATTMAGPVFGFGNDVLDLTAGNALQVAAGEDPKLGRDTIRMLRNYTPGGNIWYANLAYHRGLLDSAQQLVDADADAYFRRRIRAREREYDQGFWWPEGRAVPERAPDIANTFAPQE